MNPKQKLFFFQRLFFLQTNDIPVTISLKRESEIFSRNGSVLNVDVTIRT